MLIADVEDLVHMQESVTMSRDISLLRGTVRYMSPEMLKKFFQLETDNPGRKTDVWSLGCIMMEIAEHFFGSKTGEKLLEKDGNQIALKANGTNSQFAELILDGYVPLACPKIPQTLPACVRLCLHRSPNERTSAERLFLKLPSACNNNVVLLTNSSSSTIVKAITIDTATNRIRVLDVPMPIKGDIFFPQLTIPNQEIIIRFATNDSRQKVHIWNTQEGNMRSLWFDETIYLRSFFLDLQRKPPLLTRPVVVLDIIYYFRFDHNTSRWRFLARDIRTGYTKFDRTTAIEGNSIYAIAEFRGKIRIICA
ncbi:uncharacterized protein LOC129602663 [Paramacrobiotus metropolitanus]|uniref:uncharacterized protein LOC129602663 n=1 Tax=Paramacrobiotus metropolitanus TaxID=2943436 RepID=UPI002445C5A0|nr:uncharacterized protein LOC129602663 [Paramacrobiotus metropolitanus]